MFIHVFICLYIYIYIYILLRGKALGELLPLLSMYVCVSMYIYIERERDIVYIHI